MSQPRAELFAATLDNIQVKFLLKTYHKSLIKLTDSQIVLHWLHNESRQLKQWTKNMVIEIHEIADKGQCSGDTSTVLI